MPNSPVEFPDFSELRAARQGDRIKIPLNGQNYYADPEPPADLVLEAVGAQPLSQEVADALAAEPDGSTLTADQRRLVQDTGHSATQRMMQFMQVVLEPESAERWATYMRPVPITATAKERQDHDKRRVTLAQVKAVYQQLLAVYSGGRPTEAPSSSNGHGATGTSSTAGAASEE